MISQAVPVIEMMNGLEKPIKTFWYKTGSCLGLFVQEILDAEGGHFGNVLQLVENNVKPGIGPIFLTIYLSHMMCCVNFGGSGHI